MRVQASNGTGEEGQSYLHGLEQLGQMWVHSVLPTTQRCHQREGCWWGRVATGFYAPLKLKMSPIVSNINTMTFKSVSFINAAAQYTHCAEKDVHVQSCPLDKAKLLYYWTALQLLTGLCNKYNAVYLLGFETQEVNQRTPVLISSLWKNPSQCLQAIRTINPKTAQACLQ